MMGAKLLYFVITRITRWLKITEKVSFQIASEASYVYILSAQKFIRNAQKWSILASFWKAEVCGQTVFPDRSILTKKVQNAKIEKFKWAFFVDFQTWFDQHWKEQICVICCGRYYCFVVVLFAKSPKTPRKIETAFWVSAFLFTLRGSWDLKYLKWPAIGPKTKSQSLTDSTWQFDATIKPCTN